MKPVNFPVLAKITGLGKITLAGIAGFGVLMFIACGNNSPAVKRPVFTDTIIVNKDTSLTVKKEPGDSLYKVYLTFDDGPAEGSYEINRIAASDSAAINVFLIGENVYKTDSMKQLFQLYQSNPFIETSNHSYSHAHKHYRLYYKDPFRVVRDFELNTDTLHLKNKIARLPGRNTWRIKGRQRSDLPDDKIAADSLAAKGYTVFGWDIEWRHYPDSSHSILTANTMMRIVENMILEKRSFIPGHVVILCHDPMFTHAYNQLQLELFIKKIQQKRGYRLEHLDKYPDNFNHLSQ
jgi:peptidoglycan/xylan/chitin deacetylase (PgdA/CDA1 family)